MHGVHLFVFALTTMWYSFGLWSCMDRSILRLSLSRKYPVVSFATIILLCSEYREDSKGVSMTYCEYSILLGQVSC